MIFRKMRRSEKATDIAKAEELLRSKDFGVLSVCGDDGYPYGVPINYVYDEGKIYFHSTSAESHKIDAIRKNEKVSFTIVTEYELIPEKLDTMYTSAVVFGRARVINSKRRNKKRHCGYCWQGLSPSLVGKYRKKSTRVLKKNLSW